MIVGLSVAAGLLLMAAALASDDGTGPGLLLGVGIAVGGAVQGMLLVAVGQMLGHLRSMARRLSRISVNSYLSAYLLEDAVSYQQDDR